MQDERRAVTGRTMDLFGQTDTIHTVTDRGNTASKKQKGEKQSVFGEQENTTGIVLFWNESQSICRRRIHGTM